MILAGGALADATAGAEQAGARQRKPGPVCRQSLLLLDGEVVRYPEGEIEVGLEGSVDLERVRSGCERR